MLKIDKTVLHQLVEDSLKKGDKPEGQPESQTESQPEGQPEVSDEKKAEKDEKKEEGDLYELLRLEVETGKPGEGRIYARRERGGRRGDEGNPRSG